MTKRAADKIAEGLAEAADYARNYAPGTFGCHEALHMASFLALNVDEALCEHRAIAAVPAWRALAETARVALYDLYQAIGAEHVGKEPLA